ncbi:MAG TPA: hypothetical protein VGP64_06910 [Polyangia bacterium]|jgi:hypothetical protein
MKKVLIGLGVLLVHTAAAHAQQVAPAGPGAQPAPAPAPSAQEMPPAYAPPPGYLPPPPPPPAYGAPPVYGPPPPVYPPPVYRPYRYAPPRYRYAPAPYYTPYMPPQRDVLDRPFTLGGGIGFGGLIFDDLADSTQKNVHRNGFSYTFRLGFGLRPGLLLLWDVEGTAAPYKSSSVMQTANLVALQVFCTQRFFLKGGFGFAGASQDSLATQWGAAAMGGIGYELVQGWNWSFDIEATITGAHINTNGDDQVWTNWSLLNFALNFF